MSPARSKHYLRWKRIMDVTLASLALLGTAPLQMIIACLVRRHLGSPVLFRQQRPGLHGRPFTLVKFRTMLPDDIGAGPASDAARLTPFGSWLRATSLDELPTFWNVVKGDMSLVGPRPLLMSYLDRYNPEQARRHEVRPGVTGLSQIRGRNALTWEDKFASDVEYVNSACMTLDLRIIMSTVGSVARRHGITAIGEATMPEFAPFRTPADTRSTHTLGPVRSN
jgi:lipopolysaccharide/colanic/teichoic acid biosynthesis glycosyltransferase